MKAATFTPLAKTGRTRLSFQCAPSELAKTPRGIDAAGKTFKIVTLDGKTLTARVVSCGLPRCFCDARLV